MHLAILTDDAIAVDEDRGIVALPVRGFLSVPEVEGDVGGFGGIEQRPQFRTRHFGFEMMVHTADVIVVIAGEKGRQGQFWKNHQMAAALLRLAHAHGRRGALPLLGVEAADARHPGEKAAHAEFVTRGWGC